MLFLIKPGILDSNIRRGHSNFITFYISVSCDEKRTVIVEGVVSGGQLACTGGARFDTGLQLWLCQRFFNPEISLLLKVDIAFSIILKNLKMSPITKFYKLVRIYSSTSLPKVACMANEISLSQTDDKQVVFYLPNIGGFTATVIILCSTSPVKLSVLMCPTYER